ncbi:MAG: PEGA domain-containing protein [Deltaproteobacteria bacterium]|nr:PEGA domain-containing protein [Deltaproteobacteria bacterium]
MVHRIIFWSHVAALALSLLLAGPPAWAQAQPDPKAIARQIFAHAIELLDKGDYAQAAAEFRRAYELSPHYSVLYNLGQVHVELGKPVEALDAFERYLQGGGGEIVADRRKKVEEDIERLKGRVGELSIAVTPAAAAVSLDGRALGHEALAAPIRVVAGDHEIGAALAGYLPASRKLSVVGRQQQKVELALAPEPPKPVAPPAAGKLSVSCPVAAMAVLAGGRQLGTTPLSGPVELPAGKHRLRFERPGYRAAEPEVAIASGASTSVDCGARLLSPVPQAVAAMVAIEASEPGVEPKVDGAPMPKDGGLPAGPHRVDVELSGFLPWHQQVSLEAGKTTRLDADLVPTPGFKADYESRADAHRTWAYVLGGGAVALGAVAAGLYGWNDGRYVDWQGEQLAIDEAHSAKKKLLSDLDQHQTDNDDLIGSIQTVDGVAIGLAAASGAMLAAGVVVFLTGPDPDRYQAVALLPAPGGGVLGWRGAW